MTGVTIQFLVVLAMSALLTLLAILGIASLLNRPLPERVTGILTPTVFFLCLACLGSAGAIMISGESHRETVQLGRLLSVGEYEFQMRLLIDPLSLIFATFTQTLCGVIAAFAHRYMHKEPGYNRFFVMMAMFSLGMMLIVLAGSLQVLFAGWEFVGVSSALLIAFFHDREMPVRNGFFTFVIYRVTDFGLLCAAVFVNHSAGGSVYDAFLGTSWPDGETSLTSAQAGLAGVLLLFSAMGKCAQLPFSGWLPRAMEGPAPSSAIFYGALSVHAGAFVLLRMSPLLDRSLVASGLVVLVGVLTALYATLVGRVQTDIKSALAYAALTQVGIILAEIGLGFRWLPLIHMIGHASIRSLQFLRASSLLHDFHTVESALGGHLAHTGMHLERMVPEPVKWRLYRFALERGYADGLLHILFVTPFTTLLKALDRLEVRWCSFLSGDRGGQNG